MPGSTCRSSLQRDTKIHRDGREGMMKEVERERMLRVDTEQRLQEMREERDSCRARLRALQVEFRKMEDMVRDMLQYKSKIDQLKQEKANLAATYESNVQKCRNHISTLERENMMLLNQVKKMEAQLHGKGDDRDKSRLLLERLKMVEGENSSLVLENEQQRQQYEKCLDQIANQVVQALLAQKTLREECLKLQNRVYDLEMQNQQLNTMFQQRVRFPSEPSLQQVPYNGRTTYVHHAECGEGEASGAQLLQGSVVSLHSMFSETMFEDTPGYPQMSTPPPWLRDRLELPLDDEISLSSSASGSPSSPGQPAHSCLNANSKSHPGPSASSGAILVPGLTTKIETEFPATNASPKMKHINVSERGTRSLDRRGEGYQRAAGFRPLICSVGPMRGSTESVRKGKVRSSSEMLAMNQLSEQAWQKLEAQVKSHKSTIKQAESSVKQSTSAEVIVNAAAAQNSPTLSQKSPSPSSAVTGEKVKEGAASTGQELRKSGSQTGKETVKSSARKAGKSSQVSPLFAKVKLRRKGSNSSRDSSRSPHRPAVRNSMPPSMPYHSQYYYDYSDEDSDSRPVSRVYSCASTVSLSELLDTSGEGDFALDDDFFSDWSSMCLSPQHRLPIHPTNVHLHPSPQGQSMAGGSGQGSSLRCGPGNGQVHRRQLSRTIREREEQTDGGSAKTEREDSGCEVEASHSHKNESSQCNSGEDRGGLSHGRGESCPLTAAEVGIVNQSSTNSSKGPDSSSSRPSASAVQRSDHISSQDLCVKRVSDSAAVVCTVSTPSKTVTKVCLPSPQAAVLIQQPAWCRSDSEHSPISESSCAGSPEKHLKTALGITSLTGSSTNTDRDQGLNSDSTRTSTVDMPSVTNTCSPSNKNEVFGSASKLKSKPLTAEEKSRACRPDQLILAPADKTVHGFTSSSSCNSEDKSFPQALSPEGHLRQCSRTTNEVSFMEGSQASSKSKKTPPPVPHKPSKSHLGASQFTSLSHGSLSSVSTKSSSSINNTDNNAGVNSISSISGDSDIGNKKGTGVAGSFPPETTLTVGFMSVEPQQLEHVARNPDTVRDFVNSLVRNMKERVARHSDWPNTSVTTTTGPLAYCKSLDSSFESLRAERSGSKDDGYSTMSSDIHPVAMDKHSYVDIMVAKPTTEVTSSVRKASDFVHDLSLVGSPKRRNKSTEASETDSAMETSAHSIDTRNSSHSLSSQVSSSSGENILSPVAKATKMAQFFDDESTKSFGSSTSTATHPLSFGTPSPLSPTGLCSLGSGDSSACLSPKSSLTSPESDGSFKQMYGSVVSKLTPMPVTSAAADSEQPLPHFGTGTAASSPVVSPTSCCISPLVSSPQSGSVGQRIHDMVQNFQAGLKEKAVPTGSLSADQSASELSPGPSQPQSVILQPLQKISAPSPAHRLSHQPSDFRPSLEGRMVRSPVCDFKKYEINDPSKRNVFCSSATDTTTRRENVVSWPPRKITPPLTLSPVSPPVAFNQSLGWDMTSSPLHFLEDKVLDDIPEESGDEWDSLCVRSTQERQQLQQHAEGKGRSTTSSSGGSSPSVIHWSMKKCKSEGSLSEKPRAVSLYDEMMSGSWDSSKVLERSASVSEVDFRSTQNCFEDRSHLHRSSVHFSFNEADIQEKVAILLGHSKLVDACSENWIPSISKEVRELPENHQSSVRPIPPSNELEVGEDQQPVYNNNMDSKEKDDSSDDSHRSPSVAQKLFHSEFYSLCPVVSNRSLASSIGSVYQQSQEHLNDEHPTGSDACQGHLPHPSCITEGIHAREFDEISHQIASLSHIVDELNRSLNSLNSGGSLGSKQDLQDSDSTEEGQGKEASGGGGAWSSSRQVCIEGYHWVEDEFYLTSCGGEVIIGSAALLAEEEGMEDYVDGGGGEEGSMFAMVDNDDAIADDAQDDFYCIRIPSRRESQTTGSYSLRPVSGGSESDHILNNLAHFRYNSDGQLSKQPTARGEQTKSSQLGDVCSLSQALHASASILTSPIATVSPANGQLFYAPETEGGHEGADGAQVGGGDGGGSVLSDKEHRANMLDSMLPSGGESNDSLSSDIGLDHMMCQRLIGRKGGKEVIRFSASGQRPALDLSHFFQHFSKMEQDAVAAFDFLEDISTSESTEHLDMTSNSATRRCRSASQPLSREVVLRQTQTRQLQLEGHCSTRNPRPLSETDFRKFCLPANQRWQDQRYPSYYSYTPPPLSDEARRQSADMIRESEGAVPVSLRRQKVRRRRKRSEVKDKSHSKDSNSVETGTGGAGREAATCKVVRGSRGRRGGERLRKEWHDIKAGDPVANTLFLSDSCCDSSSSPSPPSLSYTDLSKF